MGTPNQERKEDKNGNTSATNTSATPPTTITEPHQPNAVELTEVQGRIIAMIGLWAPDAQRRVLNSTGVLLGVALGPQQKQQQPQGNQRPASNQGRR